jgi:hypothetical protein
MPYIPQVNGPTIWVDDDDKDALRKFSEDFNTDIPQKDFGGISKTEAEEEDNTSIFDPREPVRAVAHGLTGIPGDLYGLGQRIGLGTTGIPGMDKLSMQEGGLLWGLTTIGKSDEDKERIAGNVRAEQEANKRLGVRADGSAYGLPSSWGIYSDNNQIRKEWLEPRTGFHKLGSNIVSVLGSAYLGGGGGYTRTAAALTPVTATKVGPAYALANALKLPAKSSGLRATARGAVIFTVKDLLPNALEDIAYFQPGPNKEVGGALDAISELPEEDRRLAIQALLAETDTEYDYSMEVIKEVAGGAISVGVLRGIFSAARRFLKRAPKEIPTTKADGTPADPKVVKETINKIVDEEVEKELPNMAQQIDSINVNKAETDNLNRLGKLNTDLRSQIDTLTRELSETSHKLSEEFLNKSTGSPIVDDVARIDELGKAVDARSGLDATTRRITELQDALRKGTGGKGEDIGPEELPIFKAMVEKELGDMQTKIDEQPIQYVIGKRGKATKKRIPRSGWLSNTANSRRFRKFNELKSQLDELEKITESKSKYEQTTAGKKAAKAAAEKDLTDYYQVGEDGFRKYVDSLDEFVKAVDKTNIDRMDVQNAQNGLLAELGRNDEIIDLQPNDPFYQSYIAAKELIEEAKAQKSFSPEFIENFVRRADEIHEAVIKAGGAAPDAVPGSKIVGDIEKEVADKAQKEVSEAVEEVVEIAQQAPEKSLQEILEEQPVRQAPELPRLKPRLNKAGELEVIADGVPTPVDKKTFLSKFIRLAPEGKQAEIAFERLKEAVEKVEKGFNIPFEKRTALNTVGDLINLLNVGRVATEETVQRILIDLNKTIEFLADARPVLEAGAKRADEAGRKLAGDVAKTGKQIAGDAVGKIQGATEGLEDRLLKWSEDEMRRLSPEDAEKALGPLPGRAKAIENTARALSEFYEVTYEEALKQSQRTDEGFGWGAWVNTLKRRPPNVADDLAGGPKLPQGGGKGPVEPDPWGGDKADPDDLIPPRKNEITNEVPLTPEGKIDSDAIALNRSAKANPELGQAKVPVPQATKAINKDNNFLKKVETDDDVRKLGRAIADQVVEMQRLAADGALNEKSFAGTKWFNTDTLKYVADLDEAAVAKYAVDVLGERGINIGRHALLSSVQMLKKLAEFPEAIDDVLGEGSKYADDVKAGLPWVIVTTSMVENNSKALLKTSRILQDIRNGKPSIGGYTEETALLNFKNSYITMMANIKVVSNLFEGFGNGLRLMRRDNRLAFEAGRPELSVQAFADMTRKWNDTDKFVSELASTTRTATAEVEAAFDDFIKLAESGEEITDEAWRGIDNLVTRVHEAQGDLTKLKELEVTGQRVIRTIQSGGMISSPMTISSIPPMSLGELFIKQSGLTASSWINLAVERFVRNATGDEWVDAMRQAKQNTLIWKNYAATLGEAYEASKSRFLYGRSISDPGVFNKAAEIEGRGVLAEQQIMDDLRATQIKIPFTDVVLNKADFEKTEAFEALNNLRVSLKVFHDYSVAGEAWEKRGWAAKWLLAPTVSAARKLPGLNQLGTKSFYANGEMVNMTAPFQFAALGDEFTTAWHSNAAIKTKIEIDIDERIVAGTLAEADRADELKKLFNKGNQDFYAPVTAGLDNETIGHQIIDNQLDNVIDMTREVNRTEKLTGPFAAAGDWINAARYHEGRGYSPYLQLFSNTMAGVVTSPLNSIKWGLRYGLGTDIWHAAGDTAVLGVKSLADHLPEELQKRITQNHQWVQGLQNFESKYFSKDLNVRTKAQGALAVAVGMHSMAYMQLNDPNLEITGGLENTYRSEQGQVGLYTMKIDMPWGSFRLPYRWIPVYGSILAMQATMRDIDEFGIQQGEGGFDLFGAIAGSTANYIMETPGLVMFDRMFKALEGAARRDTTQLTQVLGQAVAGIGEPYFQFRKFMTEGFNPEKPSNLGAKFQTNEFWLNNPEAPDNPIWATIRAGAGSIGTVAAHSYEYNVLGFLTDEINNIIQGHPEGRNRRALWYGKPGENIEVRNAGRWNALRAIFGRYMPFPNDLDSVGTEMVNNLIQPPRADLYSGKDYGVRGVNKKVLNDFNHFLNEEFTYYDAKTGRTYVGINAALKDFIESDYYQSLPSLSSPYASSGYKILPGLTLPYAHTPPNWDRKNNTRRSYLASYVRVLINKAKEDFMMGDYDGQQYMAPTALKEAVLKHRRDNLGAY